MKKVSANKMVVVIVIILLIVAGYFIMMKKSATPADQVDQTISVSPSPVSETANLKTYNSTSLGYSVSYPSSWIVDKSPDGTEDIHPLEKDLTNSQDNTYFNISLDTSRSNPVVVRTFEEVRQSEKKNFGGRDRTETSITFAGENAYAYTENYDPKNSFYEIIVEHNNKIFDIWTQNYNLNEVKKIFATFKFTK